MLAGLGAAFRRLFSIPRTEGVADERRRRRSHKRRREETMGDVGGASTSAKCPRRDSARRSGTERHAASLGWLQQLVRKPIENYFVRQALQCLQPHAPPAVPEPARPAEQTTYLSSQDSRSEQTAELSSSASLSSDGFEYGHMKNHDYGSAAPVGLRPSPDESWCRRRGDMSDGEARAARRPPHGRNGARYPVPTPLHCIRLDEKRQYQQLVEHYTTGYLKPRPKPQVRDVAVSTIEEDSPAERFERLDLTGESPRPARISRNLLRVTSTLRHGEQPRTVRVRRKSPERLEPLKQLPPLLSSPFLSSSWLEDLKARLADSEESQAARIQRQQRACEGLRSKDRIVRPAKVIEEVTLLEPEDAEVAKEEALPELTPDMEAAVDKALRPKPPEEVLARGFKLLVTRKDMETLAGLNWLNDEVINFYMNLLMERGRTVPGLPSVYAFNTFFYPKLLTSGYSALRRWTRHVDIFAHDLVLIPVHLGAHWCLAVIDFRAKSIRYLDSLGGSNPECHKALRQYLQEESRDKRGTEMDLSDWTFEAVKDIPQQMNGSDCGMFTLKYAEYITRDAKVTFDQMHMPYFRRRMVYEILTKKLL